MSSGLITDDLQTFINQSEMELNRRKDDLEVEKSKIISFMQEYFLDKINDNASLQGRVKTSRSLREKIIRKRYIEKYDDALDFINNLPDIIGIRLVCMLEKEEKSLYESLGKIFTKQITNDYMTIPEIPRSTNYLAMRLHDQPERQQNGKEIYRISCEWYKDDGSPIKLELQIKSLINMFWGELEHMLFYKNYSYVVGADFYKSMMDSTHKMLLTVDSQLETIKIHLSNKDENGQIEEIKQIVAKFMYDNYKDRLNPILQCEIDLREVYNAIVDLYFTGVFSKEKAFERANQAITQLNSRCNDLGDNIFQFPAYSEGLSSLDSQYKAFSKIVARFGSSHDVYWKALIGIHKLMSSDEEFTRVIDNISLGLLGRFNKMNEDFDDLDCIGNKILKAGVINGIIEAVSEYKKLDFFYHETKFPQIYICIAELIREQKDDFNFTESNLNPQIEKDVIEIIGKTLSLKIMAMLDMEVKVEKLIGFYSLKNKEGLYWTPEINDSLIESHIRDKIVMTSNTVLELFSI